MILTVNRGVIWLLIIAVVVIGLFLLIRRPPNMTEQKDEIEDKMEEQKEEMEELPGIKPLNDGTYSGQSDKDDHNNYGSIEIEVKNTKISAVNYKEYTDNDQPKGADYPYKPALDAMPELEKQLVDKQDPDKVDDIAGATGTSDKFRVAAKRALEKAR